MKRALVLTALLLAVPTSASAADKKKCLDSAPRGQELRDQGKLLEAREMFLVCADPACPPPVPTYCAEWLEDLKKKIPSFVLHVTDSAGKDVTDATVTIDGHPATLDGKPIDVELGPHQIHVSRGGSRDSNETVTAAAGERDRVVTIKLASEASVVTPPPARESFFASVPLGSWIGWGVGAVGLIGFGVFGTKANLDYSDYKSSCGNRCAPSARDDIEGTMVVADVALGIAVVGAAVGTIIYFVSRPSVDQRAAR